jgi:DNA polymerase III delta prime subunit
MENIDKILERENISNNIKTLLNSFDENCKNLSFKRGIYIYGSPGCGKTHFVMNLLKELNYDIIKYDAGDVRNKVLIDTITSNNVSNRNVLQMMSKKVKKIAIVMDEIDGMNNGDKGGITALIKLIRQKKTKKQKLESITMNPVICIGNYYIDKKIKELMKVCNTFELKTPTTMQMKQVLETSIPLLHDKSDTYKDALLNYIQGDMRKLNFVKDIFINKNNKSIEEILTEDKIQNIFSRKSFNEDSKKITKSLINQPVKLENHNKYMNETDRTIVALLWHENIVDAISDKPIDKKFPFYSKILKNICYADYIDRITFQSQIWQFNEMSSLMKTFYNNKLYHDTFPENLNKYNPDEVRFTKVLTKYSTEYNNILFIYNLCQKLDIDKRDLISMFQEIRLRNYSVDGFTNNNINHHLENTNEPPQENNTEDKIEKIFENYNISKLDIKRIYRYLDKNIKKDTTVSVEDEIDNDDISPDVGRFE